MTTHVLAARKLWALEDLQSLVNDFMEAARLGYLWDQDGLAFAGRYNYRAIGEYIIHRAHSEKYRPFVNLDYKEVIDGGKEESVTITYSDERDGTEACKLKIRRA